MTNKLFDFEDCGAVDSQPIAHSHPKRHYTLQKFETLF